jgi:hypothetical protein
VWHPALLAAGSAEQDLLSWQLVSRQLLSWQLVSRQLVSVEHEEAGSGAPDDCGTDMTSAGT